MPNNQQYKSLTADVEPVGNSGFDNEEKEKPKKEEKVDIKQKMKDIQKKEKQQEKQNLNQLNKLIYKINYFLENATRVPLTQKIFFVQNLGIMMKAGLSLGQALKAIKEQTPNKRLKNILTDITVRVEKGQSFAAALKNYPQEFSELFISMIESGELSGNLEKVFKQLHHQMKRNHELISKVKGAMIYPIIVVTAMVGIGAAMIVFVMPKFISIFEELEAELPLPTQILIAVSNFVQANGFFVALGLIIIIATFIKFIKTKTGKTMTDKLFLILPILSPVVKKINLARFSRTMSSLIKTDIPIVKSFNITANTLGNTFYHQALLESAEKVKKGVQINQALREYPKIFPPVVTQMITVGEESGSIDEILEEVADFYEEDIDQTMKNLPQIIEPILMLVLGLGVGFMAVSVLMPMYSLSEAF